MTRNLAGLSVLAALWLAAWPAGQARAGLLLGKPIQVDALGPPDITTVFDSVQTTVIDPGIEYTDGVTNFDVLDTQIELTFISDDTFTSADFNGFGLFDFSGSIDAFTGVTINGATNLAGFDASRISFDADHIYINLQGLAFTTDSVVLLDVSGGSVSAVPEPSTLIPAFVSVTLAGLGFARRRRPAV